MMSRLACLAAFLVVTSASGCADLIKPPVIALEDVEVTEMTLAGPSMRAQLRVRNPNFFPVTTTKVVYTVTVEGAQGEQETMTERFTVPANGDVQIVLPIRLPWAAGIGALGAALKRGVVETESKGTITVDALLASVEVPFVLAGRFNLNDDDGKAPAPAEKR